MNASRFCRVAVAMASWLAVFWLSWQAPHLSDDFYMMSKMFGEGTLPPGHFPTLSDVLSIPDVWQSYWTCCRNLYCGWGGRFTAWALTFPLLCLPREVFAAVNAFMWVVLSHCAWVACGRRENTFCLVYFLMFFAGMDPEAVLWMSGSFSYLCALALAGISVSLLCRGLTPGKGLGGVKGLCQCGGLFLLGFVSVGGHELVAMTVGFCFALHWIAVLSRQGVHGLSDVRRVALTLGAWCGMLACVLAPGNFVRAAVMGPLAGGQALSLVLRMKFIHFVHVCLDRPLILLALLCVGMLALSRRLRRRLDRADVLWACALCVNLGLTMTFTDGIGRTSWFAQVIAMVFLVRVFFKDGGSRALRNALVFLSVAIAVLVVVQTSLTTRLGNGAYAKMIKEWRASPSGVVRGGYLKVCHRSSLDRSLLGLAQWGAGEEHANQTLSKFYGLPRLIVLDDWTYANVWAGDGAVTNRLQRLSVEGEWYADPKEDVLVGVCREPSFVHGQPLIVRPRYRTIGFPAPSLKERLMENADMLLRRNICAWTKGLPRQEIVNESALPGTVLETAHGKFFVVRHNHAIDRSLITDLRVKGED